MTNKYKEMIVRKWAIIFMLSFLVGCYSESKYSGTFYNSKRPDSFIIKEDSTFTYRYKFAFDYKYSDGSWNKVGKNKISLTSNIRSKLLPLMVQEKEVVQNLNNLDISVSIPENEKKYYSCTLFINDVFFVRKNCDSFTSILIDKPIESIYLKLIADERLPTRYLDSLVTEKYLPKSPGIKNLKIDIVFNDSMFNYKIFGGEIVKFTKKGIKFYSRQINRWIFLDRK